MTKYDNIIPMKKYNGASLTQEQIEEDKIDIEKRIKILFKDYWENRNNEEYRIRIEAMRDLNIEALGKDVQDIKKNCADKTKDCLGIQKIQGSVTTQLIFQWIVIAFMISIIFLIMRGVGMLKIF